MKKLRIEEKREERWPVVQECEGCDHREGNFCNCYAFPEAKWGRRKCPMATHLQKSAAAKKDLNPLKASKRKARGK